MNKIEYLNKIKEFSQNKELYIVGCGNYGKKISAWLQNNNVQIDGFVDKNSNGSIGVFKIFNYNHKFKKDAVFIISSEMFKNEMLLALENNGITKDKIISDIDRDLLYELIQETENWNKVLDRNKQFKNLHDGKRCFIIGNGPSLALSDLDKIKKEISFGCNSIYALYSKTEWRPTYYCSSDPIGIKLYFGNGAVLSKIANNSTAVFTNILYDIYCSENRPDNLFFYKTYLETIDGLICFSSDFSDKVYISGTITYIMLQLAVYMGFKEIYLLGIDFTFSAERKYDGSIVRNDVVNHQADIEIEEDKLKPAINNVYGNDYLADIDKQLAGYKAAKQYADYHGIKIYNATRGGKLEVFPRVDFDSLFEN